MRTQKPKPWGWWVSQFLANATDVNDFDFSERESLFFDPVHGFFCWDFSPSMKLMTITKGCGDIRYFIREQIGLFYVARAKHGTEYLVMHTTRCPNALARLIHGEIFQITKGRKNISKYWIKSSDPLNIMEVA